MLTRLFQTWWTLTRRALHTASIEWSMRADDSIPVETRQSLPVTTYLIRMILWFTYGTYRLARLSYGIERSRRIALDGDTLETTVTYRAGLPLVSEVRSCDILDGLDLRAAAYAEAYSLGVCESAALSLTGQLVFRTISDEALIQWMMASTQANSIVHTGGHTYVWGGDVFPVGEWAADLQYLPSFQAPDVVRIHLDTVQGTIVYEDRAGQLVSTGDPRYPAARYHGMAMIAQATTIGGLHSWVHFHLQSIIAEGVALHLRPASVLHSLLTPHVRFVHYINYQALWKNSSTTPDLQEPTFAFGMSIDDSVLGGIHRGVHEKYVQQYGKGTGRCFFEPESEDEPYLPYHRILDAYYQNIEAFVARVLPAVDQAEYLAFEAYVQDKYVGEWFPSDRTWETRATCLLSCFIHQTSVVHSIDHYSFWVMVAAGGLPSRVRKTSFGPSTRDLFHTACANNMFSYTHPMARETPGNHLLIDTVYGFSPPGLQSTVDAFHVALRETETDLRSKHLVYCPLSKMYASTCG